MYRVSACFQTHARLLDTRGLSPPLRLHTNQVLRSAFLRVASMGVGENGACGVGEVAVSTYMLYFQAI